MRPFLTPLALPNPDDDVPDYWDRSSTSVSTHQDVVDAVEEILPPWLAKYDIDRLGTLFDCLMRAREPILVWAARIARLDVMSWVHDQFDLDVCSNYVLSPVQSLVAEATKQAAMQGHFSSMDYLLTAYQVSQGWLDNDTVAAISFQGHRHILEYLLARLVQDPSLLRRAIVSAAANSHLDIARWLHTQLLALDLNIEFYDATDHALWIASTTRTDDLNERCVGFATRYQQKLVDWLVQYASALKIVEIYLREDESCSILDAYVDPNFDVDVDNISIGAFTLSHNLVLSNQRIEEMSRPVGCTDTWHRFRGSSVVLTETDVRDDVDSQQALHVGLHLGGVPLLDFFESNNIHMSAAKMTTNCTRSCAKCPTKRPSHAGKPTKTVPTWSAKMKPTDKIARWLAMRRGGPLATLEHMLVRLAHEKKTLLQFKTLFYVWLTHVDDDDKFQVLEQCLKQRHQSDQVELMEFLVVSNPHYFVSLLTTRPGATIRKLHTALVPSRDLSPDELVRIESEALVQAAVDGRRGVVQFILQQIQSKNKDAIVHRARQRQVKTQIFLVSNKFARGLKIHQYHFTCCWSRNPLM
ncbi:Aste57867_24140 [Aphanomyces stellatus]|uniref:Aste57867_24140 protein n=1 Tax=Aphanomyces stellatus TaxID=120398 RepID=A0A485KAT6_9STRA|nr:hypothetical protein As57867_024066 [Aphanomyces stellatus]KAF0715287.1 hypothetical protein As57867_003445 [Aphanomyces stellatus]KAF0715295.1 hypothetical protein As57867_003453 [Aphanomyces stellatus]VFT80621.1 Aste57867_3455 [Aphanomyces stellatus]VFT80629.1 Aste57867_3463 [Aphanomyces stellatus]